MKKSLIFGLPGQDSYFLSNLLIARGDHVTGCHRHTYLGDQSKDFQSDKMYFWSCDMMDRAAVDSIINLIKPDEVYNLAAHSFVGDSFTKPAQIISNNVISHINLLESIRVNIPQAKLYYSGSSEELNIKSPYGVSKDAVRNLNDIYRNSYDMFICHAQNFNHTSWRHSPQFLVPKVTKYVANLKRWLEKYKVISLDDTTIMGRCIHGDANFSWLPKLELGSLTPWRDILYAEDVMRAAILMMEQKESGTYKVASGQLNNIYSVVNYAFETLNLGFADFIFQDNKFVRPKGSEACPPIESCAELRELGWAPTFTLKELIRDIIDEYIKRGIK